MGVCVIVRVAVNEYSRNTGHIFSSNASDIVSVLLGAFLGAMPIGALGKYWVTRTQFYKVHSNRGC